jgi:hypothetical protein
MGDKNDVLKEVGRYVANEVKKQVAADPRVNRDLVGAAKQLNDQLNEYMGKELKLSLQIFRVDPYNPTTERYVSTIDNVSPELLYANSLEATVKSWCGGGKYRIKIQADGMPEKVQPIDIEGEPLPPVPERNRGATPQPYFNSEPRGQGIESCLPAHCPLRGCPLVNRRCQ